MKILVFHGVAAICGLLMSFIFSQDSAAQDAPFRGLSVSVGYYDINSNDDEATDFRVEYRSSYDLAFQIRPFLGAELTTDGSYLIGGGFLRDISLGNSFYLTPSLGAFYYEEGESTLDLGHPLEFRTQIEIGYQTKNKHRVSLGFSHISNASLDENNPGAEILSLYYHFPLHVTK